MSEKRKKLEEIKAEFKRGDDLVGESAEWLIAELEAALDRERWIPVNEKKPLLSCRDGQISEPVLIAGPMMESEHPSEVHIRRARWWKNPGTDAVMWICGDIEHPTHWRPLPAPPTETD